MLKCLCAVAEAGFILFSKKKCTGVSVVTFPCVASRVLKNISSSIIALVTDKGEQETAEKKCKTVVATFFPIHLLSVICHGDQGLII